MFPSSKWLNWEIGLGRTIMSRFLTPIRETKLRILMCLAVAALAQPHLVWCFESSGHVKVEWPVCCCGFLSSATQSGDHCLVSPCSGTCDSCFDVPISLTASEPKRVSHKGDIEIARSPICGSSRSPFRTFLYSAMCLQFPPFSPM